MAYKRTGSNPYFTPGMSTYPRTGHNRFFRGGLGGASDCGAGQIWDPNFVFPGLPPGQCVTQAQSDANKAANPSQYAAPASSPSFLDSLFGGLAAGLKSATPQPMPVVAPSSGISTTTMVVAGVAIVGLALILTRNKS